jgi:hypothetical protein
MKLELVLDSPSNGRHQKLPTIIASLSNLTSGRLVFSLQKLSPMAGCHIQVSVWRLITMVSKLFAGAVILLERHCQSHLFFDFLENLIHHVFLIQIVFMVSEVFCFPQELVPDQLV